MLLFMDGQGHYDSTRIGHKYSAISHDHVQWSVTAEGRFGNCLKRLSTANTGNPGFLSISPLTTRLAPWTPTPNNGGVCGFALKVDDLTRAGGGALFTVLEGSTTHVYVRLNPAGTFTLWRYGTTEDDLVAQSSEGLTGGTWMFVEFKWVIHATTGLFQIRVNGIEILSYTGNTIETHQFTPTLGLWNAVHVLGVQSTAVTPRLTMRMCDLYLADLTSSAPDDVSDFLGDGIIETILPNNPGASTGWTPSTVPNWNQVNDRPAPDDDGSYVAAVFADTLDTYHFEDIPTDSVVKGIHVNLLARKEEPGSVTLAPVVHQAGVDYLGPVQGVTNVIYDRYLTQAWDLNPATGAKFTPAEINAGQFGVVKVV
jgi:hypothetical protein